MIEGWMACSSFGVRGVMPTEKVMMAWSLRRLSESSAASCVAFARVESSWAACEGRLMKMRSIEVAAKPDPLKRA
eukprot:8980377-Pyramimonas_sp.AAC.1